LAWRVRAAAVEDVEDVEASGWRVEDVEGRAGLPASVRPEGRGL
jgi:hypothetical protein